jgi:hypothetical protein
MRLVCQSLLWDCVEFFLGYLTEGDVEKNRLCFCTRFSIAPFYVIFCFINPNSFSQQISVRSTTLLLFARRLQTGEPAGITTEEMTVVASESRVIINTGQMHEIAFTASGLTYRKCPIYLVQQILGYVCLFKPFILSCPVQDSMF